MSIVEAALTIGELEEEIARANAARYCFARMLNATDRILGRLEEMNLAGVEAASLPDRAGWREALQELPSAVIGPWPSDDCVQQLLDGLFEVQERLLRWRDPDRRTDEEDEGEPAGRLEMDELRARVLARLRDAGPVGLASSDVVPRPHKGLRRRVMEVLAELEAAGLAGCYANGSGQRWFVREEG